MNLFVYTKKGLIFENQSFFDFLFFYKLGQLDDVFVHAVFAEALLDDVLALCSASMAPADAVFMLFLAGI